MVEHLTMCPKCFHRFKIKDGTKARVIKILKNNPTTFYELQKLSKMSKSQLSYTLFDLEKEQRIKRTVVPRKTKKGKQRNYKILISLKSTVQSIDR